MRLWRGVFFFAVVALFVLPVLSQVNTGDIVGRVLDPKGLAVPGAKVTVASKDTGLTREAATGDTGDFAVTLLPPGTYKVTVAKEGFATTLYEKVELAVGAKQSLDVSLKLGTGRETVTVSEQPPLIESTRSDLGGSVSPTEMQSLPVLDRNFAGLMTMIPGVRPAQGFDPTKTRSGNVTINGSDGRAVDYNVDGGDNKDNVIGGLVQNFTMEGIQEFNVIVDRYTAESGRTAAAVVNVITKSGTNGFHGSLFSEFQLSTFNKKSFFDRLAGPDGKLGTADDIQLPKPVYHRYHFGGSVGGPIIKDTLFFFGAYEHKREPGAFTTDPTVVKNLKLFPLAAPVSQIPNPYLDHLATVKVDHHISDRQNMFYRYARERWETTNDQGAIADLTETNGNTNQFHSLVIQHNYAFASNKVNSASAHFQDFVNAIPATPQRTFTLPVAGGGTTTNPNIVFPNAEMGQNTNVPQQTLIRKYQLRDDFSWTRNRHNMKLGVNYIYLAKLGGFFFFGANGYQIMFFDDPTDILGSKAAFYPQGFATPGAVQEITFSGGSGSTFQPPAHSIALYYQDDFKVTPHFTLNLGVRWDANPRFLPRQLGDTPTTSNRTINLLRQIVAANPAAPGAADGLARAKAITSNADDLRRTTADWKEFQPRIGFAWDPTGSGKHVIRGGYGIARDQVFQNLTLFSLQQFNPSLYQTIIDQASSTGPACPPPATTGNCASGQLATFRFPDGVPTHPFDPLPPPGGAKTDIEVGGFGRINDPKFTDSWSQQSSIGWAWQFSPDFAFSADYYHVLGTHEPRVLNINPKIVTICGVKADGITPSFPGGNPGDPRCVRRGSTRFFDAAFAAAGLGAGRLEQINEIGSSNRSRFDSVNFQLKKRFSHHNTFQISYVLSRSDSWGGRATSSYSGNSRAITPENEFKAGEFGPTVFDERHRFVASGVFALPWGFEIAPIFQAASARPVDFKSGRDNDGDGRKSIDRVCVGTPVTPGTPVGAPNGCQQVSVNALRGDPFVQLDLRATKKIKFNENMSLRLFWEAYNLFNRNNFCNAFVDNASSSSFLQPLGYCGAQGFGPSFSGPLRSQFGFRFEF